MRGDAISQGCQSALDRGADSTAPLRILHHVNGQIVQFRNNAVGGVPGHHNNRGTSCVLRGFRDATEERFAFELEKLLRLAEAD